MVSPAPLLASVLMPGLPWTGLPVCWLSAIEKDVATYLEGTAKSHFSQQGSVGVSDEYLTDDLPHTKLCANSWRAYKYGEDAVPVVKWPKSYWKGYSKYL